jgi:hypothetical protein
MDEHQKSTRLGWSTLYGNLSLNAAGILVIFSCNVLHQGCEGIALYLGAALFAGAPLFVVTLVTAPAGAFKAPSTSSSRRYRRLFFLNLCLVALIFIPASIAIFFS